MFGKVEALDFQKATELTPALEKLFSGPAGSALVFGLMTKAIKKVIDWTTTPEEKRKKRRIKASRKTTPYSVKRWKARTINRKIWVAKKRRCNRIVSSYRVVSP